MAGRLGRWLAAVFWIIVAVPLFDGYFIFFELVMRGQTPGKRSMKVRVLRDDGTPVTINEVFVRNILAAGGLPARRLRRRGDRDVL